MYLNINQKHYKVGVNRRPSKPNVAIKNEQSRENDNIGLTRNKVKTNKANKKQKTTTQHVLDTSRRK